MRRCALVVLGLSFATTAAAQSARVEMVPMPATLPKLLFAPDPIAGTMLRPLREIQSGAPVIDPEPGPEPGSEIAQAQSAVEPVGAEPTGALAPAEPEMPPIAATEGAEAATPDTPAEAVPQAPEATALAVPSVPEVAPEPAPPSGSSVHVIVENVASAAGIVNVAVCDQGLSEEGCPYKTSAPAAQGFVEMKLDGIPPGNYAVVGYHDVNGNDEFDKFLGMPREPYALSSTAAETLVPRFQDAALPIHEGDNVVIIRLKTFGGG